jgi:TrmH family RNA methyltransferase
VEEEFIQSRQNPRVKNLVRLRERRQRERQGRFLVEGLRELGHALDAGTEVEELFFCPELFPTGDHGELIDRVRRGGRIRLSRLSASAFDKVSAREGPDGLLGVARPAGCGLDELELPEEPLLLVLEGIEKPGNLGAILRSADAAGVDAVVLADCVLDLYNPNAIRASQGLVFALPVVTVGSEKLVDWLRMRGIRTFATTPAAGSSLWETDFTGPAALLLGSESEGLGALWQEAADVPIRIPMAGRADSLNVAAAAAVCLFEARRQRDARGRTQASAAARH